jgi:hypothetical protein
VRGTKLKTPVLLDLEQQPLVHVLALPIQEYGSGQSGESPPNFASISAKLPT